MYCLYFISTTMVEDVETKSSFSCFNNVKCAISNFYLPETAVILIKEWIKDIQNHLISYKLGKYTCNDLIWYQAGIFLIMGEYFVCPNHKYSLCNKWKRRTMSCWPTNHLQNLNHNTTGLSHLLFETWEEVLSIGPGSGNNLIFKDK